MGFSDETYAAAKKYTDNTVAGAGGLAGVPCQIQSITPITGGNRVTFLWIDNNGDEHTSTMNVMNGVDGENGEDGKGIQSVSVNADNHLIITYTDGTSADAGQIEIHSAVDSVNGQTGAVVLDAEDVGALPDDTPIPSKTSDLTNNSGFITKVVNDLVNYYLKSETYSKTEVDDIVTAIKNSRFEVVATLPTTDIKTNVIYLVPKSPSQTSNVKDEYINLDGTTAGWEKIGDTEIDLSDYVTTSDLSTALADYTTTTDLTTLLAAKQDTLTFDNAPTENSNNPVKSGGIYADEKAIYEVMGKMGAKNLIYVEDFTLIKSSARTKSLTTEDFGNDIPKTQVTLSFEVSDSNLTVNGEFRAYAPLVSGVRELLGGVTYMADGTYSFSFDATRLDQLYIFINNEDETTATCKIGNVMIRFANDTDATYQPYAKTNQELTSNVTAIDNARIMYGVENILPNTLGSGTAATSVTYTRNSDGTVSISGSAVGNAILPIGKITGLTKVRLTGCPSGGGSSAYQIQPKDLTDNSYPFLGDYGEGKNYTLDPTHVYRMDIVIREGYSISGTKLFKPMVVDLSAYSGTTYGDYVPYAKTNQQLTQDSVTWDNLSEVGAVNYLDSDASTKIDSSSGLTFTVNSDKTVTVSATSRTYPFTSTALVNFVLKLKPEFSDKLPLKLSGCPSGGDSLNGYNLNYTNYSNTDNKVTDTGDGAIISTQFDYTTYPNAGIRIQVRNGTTLTGPLTFKPMLTDPSYNGPYVPYAKTNRELTEKIDIVGNLFTTTTKVVDNITHGIATTVATLENLPIGTYVVSGQFNSDSAMSGGGLVQFVSSGVIQNGASCNTMINQGFKANAGLTGIFNVTNATNQINLQIYTANADLTVVSVKLAAIRIA